MGRVGSMTSFRRCMVVVVWGCTRVRAREIINYNLIYLLSGSGLEQNAGLQWVVASLEETMTKAFVGVSVLRSTGA